MTLFTIHETDRPGNRYAVSTICLADGMIGGAGFFATVERAKDYIEDAYKTPLRECDATRYRAARRYCAAKREAVCVG